MRQARPACQLVLLLQDVLEVVTATAASTAGGSAPLWAGVTRVLGVWERLRELLLLLLLMLTRACLLLLLVLGTSSSSTLSERQKKTQKKG